MPSSSILPLFALRNVAVPVPRLRHAVLPHHGPQWDTYLSETDGFAAFHVYACAAFLKTFSEQLCAQNDMEVCSMALGPPLPCSCPPSSSCCLGIAICANAAAQRLMSSLQKLPTQSWTSKEIELLLAEAFKWMSTFGDSQIFS